MPREPRPAPAHSTIPDASGGGVPHGVALVHTLAGHTGLVLSVAFDAEGRTLASGSDEGNLALWEASSGALIRRIEAHSGKAWSVAFEPRGRAVASAGSDATVKLWDVSTGALLRTFAGHTEEVNSVAFSRDGSTLASASDDRTVKLWDVGSGTLLHSLEGHRYRVWSVAFGAEGRIVASGSEDLTIKVWSTTDGRLLRTLQGHASRVRSVAFRADGQTLASGSGDGTVRLWDAGTGQLLRTLEGHTDFVGVVAFSADGRLLASKSHDGTVRVYDCAAWNTLAVIPEPAYVKWTPALSFSPASPLLATAGSEPISDVPPVWPIHLWRVDAGALLRRSSHTPALHYVNAKVVLVGDTGVGKSGLSLVLNRQPFAPTESTPGRRVWAFETRETTSDSQRVIHETLLWDLAGQPGYRLIHQLHLNEVAVALVVFDARSETDPLAGVFHWERALRLAQQRQGALPMKKFLVSARVDRGGVSVSSDRIRGLIADFGYDGYFATSAKEGWQIAELRKAIEEAIPWDKLPVVTSEELFARIKRYLLDAQASGQLLAPAAELYAQFAAAHPDLLASHSQLAAQFQTCIGRLENRDLVRRLSFGGYVLLQPELLDAYASAMVNAAKNEPDGLGSIAEEIALSGEFFIPKENRVEHSSQQQLLLNATVEELTRHDLALRESASDGRYLVFPSQFNRDYQDAPEPAGEAVRISFDGPVQSLYSTLVVRLGHSGLFTTSRSEMWRNAAVFTARAGGQCGLFVNEYSEASGRLVVFYHPDQAQPPSEQTKFHFEEFVVAHTERRALQGTVRVTRSFTCPRCGTPVPETYVQMLRARGLTAFSCPCPQRGTVDLKEPAERLRFPSQVAAMDSSADRQRDFEVFVESARGETCTPSFLAWAGDDRVTLAIVFTDIVGSTVLGNEVGGERMAEIRRAHFARGRRLIEQHKGREIKTIGDSLMAAFHSAGRALDFSRAFQAEPGDSSIRVRAGIHVGEMQVEENDLFGGVVNFAARIVSAVRNAEIWLSDRAMKDIAAWDARHHRGLKWEARLGVEMKGFPEKFTLWSLAS